MKQLKHALRLSAVLLLVFAQVLGAKSLKIERMGKVIDSSGICALQPRLQTRWTPVVEGALLSEGDWLRTGPRGANAVQVRLADQTKLILGPGGLVELVDRKNVKLVRGDLEIVPAEGSKLTVHLPDKTKRKITETQILRAKDETVTRLENEPKWLKYFKGTIVSEPMGSLLANVEGRNLPLTLGYHKVTVDIRDQIARTTIEESFINHTSGRLEGIFHFPLPQDSSISGFGMWIGDELVEADVVELRPYRRDHAVHHARRRDHIRTRFGLTHRDVGQHL